MTKKKTINENNLLAHCEHFFDNIIKERGIDYYRTNKVINVLKDGNHYTAEVIGTSFEPYKVDIEFDDDDIDLNCDCPYEDYCKHEYAVLLAIVNKEYHEVFLKDNIKEKKITIKNLIKVIPSDELKEYFLSLKYIDDGKIDINHFKDYFLKYLPKQKYNYYYNNLYNRFMLNNWEQLINSYLLKVKKYLDINEYEEAYKIIKSIIDSCIDTKMIENDYVIDLFPKIGMFLRIINRKANKNIKKQINEWNTGIKKKKYYNNCYLEDIMISMEK